MMKIWVINNDCSNSREVVLQRTKPDYVLPDYENLTDHVDLSFLEKAGDELAFRGPSISPTTLEQLRRGDCDHVDLSFREKAGDELSFRGPFMSPDTLEKLRRGDWKSSAQLNLDEFTHDKAQRELEAFLNTCIKRRLRCVQVIYGKGLNSKNCVPILKTLIGGWLAQHNCVLAFCQANLANDGSSAVLVLLKTWRIYHED